MVARFLFGLGVRHVGVENARQIVEAFGGFPALWAYLRAESGAVLVTVPVTVTVTVTVTAFLFCFFYLEITLICFCFFSAFLLVFQTS